MLKCSYPLIKATDSLHDSVKAFVDHAGFIRYLGHGDPGFTLRTYARRMPDAADRARKAMNAFFDAKIDKPGALDVPSEGRG